MGRALGANAQVAAAFAPSYGAVPASGYRLLPIAGRVELGDEQGLVESDLLGFGRDPQEPGDDVINNTGSATVPVDLRNIGFWLKLLFGHPTTTAGLPGKGSIAFSAQPASNATLTINGTTVTFVTGTPSGSQVKIGAGLAETITNLVLFLNASADANVSVASYSADPDLTTLQVAHDTQGTAGNSFTLAASTTPASNATVSAATLAGGSASGAYRHVWVPGALVLPDAAVEIGNPDVPNYAMNYGVQAESIKIGLQRSGLLNADIALFAQGEKPATSTTATGSQTSWPVQRFSQFAGGVRRSGVPLARMNSGNFSIANGMEKDESIRPDGRIGGADPGMLKMMGDVVLRFADNVLYDLATSKTPIELAYGWTIPNTSYSLEFLFHRVRLPKKRAPITGPGGIQRSFDWMAAEDQVLNKSATITLFNDVASY